MQTKKSQPKGGQIMSETRFTDFLAFSFDPGVGISLSASETNVLLYFLSMTSKSTKYHSSFLSFLTFYFT